MNSNSGIAWSQLPNTEFVGNVIFKIRYFSIYQNKDSVIIRISYRDGDGDLGENSSGIENAEITNFRNNITYKFRIRQLAPDNANVAIQGELEFIIPGVAMENTSLASESTYFTVSITDRAGNKSNQISTDNITVFP